MLIHILSSNGILNPTRCFQATIEERWINQLSFQVWSFVVHLATNLRRECCNSPMVIRSYRFYIVFSWVSSTSSLWCNRWCIFEGDRYTIEAFIYCGCFVMIPWSCALDLKETISCLLERKDALNCCCMAWFLASVNLNCHQLRL